MLSNGIRHSCGVMRYKIVLQSNSTWQNIYAEQHVLSCIAWCFLDRHSASGGTAPCIGAHCNALHGVFWIGAAHYVAAHCNALVQPRSRFHPLYSPQKALNWGGGRAWHKALNKFFKLPSHHLCSVFFPAKRASIEFGSCLHLLWLPSPNLDNSVGVHSRSRAEPGI